MYDVTTKELEGTLLGGKKLTINAKGLQNGLRGKEDGIAFFGDKKKTDQVSFI